ncbi:MAG TPA: AraC family transcriptional regulator [Thermoanaerobaculia bacterium]|nr:AraC family transcriptional regulator [Thermoanaerobaculia bacterium]
MHSQPRELSWGAFFGTPERVLRTASFEYADRIALVPDALVPRHTHENAHFVLVVRGTYVTEARNRPGSCGEGSVIFNPAGTTHRDRFRSEQGRFFAISVDAAIAARIEAVHPAAAMFTGEAGAIAERARRELHGDAAFADLILEGLGLELAGRVARLAAHRDRQPPHWLLEARDSIHDRCTAKLAMSDVAAVAGVHPIHLARAFRQYFDCSPGEYLRRCRIERVRELLLTSDAPLADVALEAGFADQSQLTHSFRRAYGITPGAFRRGKNVSSAQERLDAICESRD